MMNADKKAVKIGYQSFRSLALIAALAACSGAREAVVDTPAVLTDAEVFAACVGRQEFQIVQPPAATITVDVAREGMPIDQQLEALDDKFDAVHEAVSPDIRTGMDAIRRTARTTGQADLTDAASTDAFTLCTGGLLPSFTADGFLI